MIDRRYIMYRQVIVAELFNKSRAAICQMLQRHHSIEAVIEIYLIRYLFGDKNRLGMKNWLNIAKIKADKLICRAVEIEEQRARYKKTNADGLTQYLKKIIEELIARFKHECRRLRRRWKILFDREVRSLLYKSCGYIMNLSTRQYFMEKCNIGDTLHFSAY